MATTARESMRRGISDRATAAIATAVLIDFGIIKAGDTSCVIDRQRIRREKIQVRNEHGEKENQRLKEDCIEGIYFDGKEIDTIENVCENGVYRRKTVKREHIVLVSQPDGKYMSHVTPTGKAAGPTTDAIFEYLEENDLINDLKVIGMDSTNVNTGHKGGIATLLEEKRGEKLHWSVCSLHTNELPLRHLFQALDGSTSGNNSFKGPIGKSLPHVEDLEWDENFTPISEAPPLPDLDDQVFNDLSSDQKYLYLAAKSIQSGKIDPRLRNLKPGPISHSRWLTLGCRLCRIYLSKHAFRGKIKANLYQLVFYVITNYAPSWFLIKSRSHFAEAANHLLFQIKRLRLLPQATRNLVDPYVKSWNAHPENLLVSLLCDEDPMLRSFAVTKIINLRDGRDLGDKSVRKFKPPPLNFSANSISELIDWESTTIFESILTCDLKADDIRNIIMNRLELPAFPVHTQSVERAIRDLTEVCGKICGHAERDNYLRACVASRNIFPKAETKKDFASLVPQ